MKQIYRMIIVLGFIMSIPAFRAFSQVGVNADGSQPDPSAMLDVKATDRGLLIPRISTATRDLIPSPASGLLIYNASTNQFNYYNGNYWCQLGSTLISSTIGTLSVGGGVSINASPGITPSNSAMLDVNNPARGILLPRTTPDLITAPATGLIIYNTVTNFLSYYDGSQWISLCAIFSGNTGASGSQASIGVANSSTNSTPHHSAMLDVSATDKGVLIPRLTDLQRDAILPVTGLVIYNTSANGIEYFNGSAWYRLISCGFTCGSPITITHMAGASAPVMKTVTYGTVTNIPGETSKCWITSNLGSDHQATAVNDATEASAGWYWQFNRKQGYKHDGTTRTPGTSWITSINENFDWQAANDACTLELGSGWRIPTSSEWTNVDAGGNWIDWNGPWSSGLKLHAAGFLRPENGTLANRGAGGNYWSSKQYSSVYSWDLDIYSGQTSMYYISKAYGFSLRCMRNCTSSMLPGMYIDDFESYTVGGYLAVQNPAWWTTWSNAPGTAEDAIISTAFASSPSKSVLIDETGGATDLLLKLGEKTTGRYELKWMMYIETAKAGYYNIEHFQSPGIEYAMEVYFRTGGTGELSAGNNVFISFAYPKDTWFEVKHMIDLDADNIQMYVNGILIHEWPFHYQATGSTGTKQLGSVDFFAGAKAGSGEIPKYFLDDLSFRPVPDHIETSNQIIWKWYTVADATGYKWNTVNDYASAIDMGSGTTRTERGLDCGTAYTRYVWAYNDCSHSTETTLTQWTLVAPPATVSGIHFPSGNQIVWNWVAANGATGYKWNTTNDYASATDMGTSLTKTETGLNPRNVYTRFVWVYNNCGNSPAIELTTATSTAEGGFTCYQQIPVSHVAGMVAPVSKNVVYNTENSLPGDPLKCWITSNLGSDHQALAVNDATEASAGWYWMFNILQGYKFDGGTRTPAGSWNFAISENFNWQAAKDPCASELGVDWRIPTFTEWNNVEAGGNWSDWNQPWNSRLKLHAAGYLDYIGNGDLVGRGFSGNYWSSSQLSWDRGWNLVFGFGYAYMGDNNKVYGRTLRCLRDETSVVYPLLQVPGGYQGWNPADSGTTVASANSNGEYEGYLWFNADNTEFKYTQGFSWNANWGDDNADGTLEFNGANIVAGPLGYYKLNVNMNNLTHTFLKTTWAVAGSATPGGWSTDNDMTYDPVTKVWTVMLYLTQAEIKFRANHSWGLNYGDNGTNGTLEANGTNIPVLFAGNYLITLDLSKPVYTWKLTKISAPYRVETSFGNNQSAPLGQPLPAPVGVMIKDIDGNPCSGAIVNFAANTGGSVSQAQVITGEDGVASVTWTLGNVNGSQGLTIEAYNAVNNAPLQGSPVTMGSSGLGNLPCQGMPVVVDSRDGQIYPTVQIGTQCWLQKNMNYASENSWCYDSAAGNCAVYGRLYNYEGSLSACPNGWHLPTGDDLNALNLYIGYEYKGDKLQEAGTAHWHSPNNCATNASGFTALPGGWGNRYSGVGYDFGQIGEVAEWFNADGCPYGIARGVFLCFGFGYGWSNCEPAFECLSVRCISN